MRIEGVVSLRRVCNENFRDIVFEWEDEIVKHLYAEIQYVDNIKSGLLDRCLSRLRGFRYHYRINKNDKVYIGFCMTPGEIRLYRKFNVLPVIIDIWPKDVEETVELIAESFAVVTSYDIYERLRDRCKNVVYMPLCISDKWISECVPEKSNTIIQMGRRNDVLHEFAIRYVELHDEIDYVYATYDEKSKKLTYYSTKRGKINTPETRTEYMSVLRHAKICLLSSPGIDNSRPVAKGIDYPTPRFYETAINYCSMIARYDVTHKEFLEQGIDKVAINVNSYQEFEDAMNSCLNSEIDKEAYDEFIKMHVTSRWVDDLLYKIKEL